MPDQYVFCHLAFLEYVLNMEHIDEIDLSGFDDDCDSEWWEDQLFPLGRPMEMYIPEIYFG